MSPGRGARRVLTGLTPDVRHREVFGYPGPNGAGESTTIRLFLDLIRPTTGSVAVPGLDSRANGVQLRRRVGYVVGYLVGDFVRDGCQTVRGLLRHLAEPRGTGWLTRLSSFHYRVAGEPLRTDSSGATPPCSPRPRLRLPRRGRSPPPQPPQHQQVEVAPLVSSSRRAPTLNPVDGDHRETPISETSARLHQQRPGPGLPGAGLARARRLMKRVQGTARRIIRRARRAPYPGHGRGGLPHRPVLHGGRERERTGPEANSARTEGIGCRKVRETR